MKIRALLFEFFNLKGEEGNDDPKLYVVEGGQPQPLFTSARLDEWLIALKWGRFTVTTCDLPWPSRRLKYFAKYEHKGEYICHYVDTLMVWDGTITICQEKLIELFGGVPRTLTVTHREE